MKLVVSENNGEYVNRKTKNEISSSNKEQIQEISELRDNINLINSEES